MILKKIKTRLLIIVGIITIGIVILPANASQCISGISLEDNYKNYDHVFSGRVESIDYSPPTNVTLWVYNTWKGNITQYMSVTTPIHDPLLGFLFVKGEEYLIFSESGYWTNNMTNVYGCSPSGLLSQSHDAIMQLEEITNYTNSKKLCNSDRVACYNDQIVCDRSGWDCRGGGDSTGVFSKVIELPEPVEPTHTKEELAKTSILCIGGYKQAGLECVPEDTLTISYGHQWILTILLMIIVLIAISIGIIFGVKAWRKRK
jgi:hypothetical protein